MKKIPLLLILLAAMTTLACGSPDVAACNNYYDYSDALECNEGEITRGDVCNEQPEGCAEYWECVERGTSCSEDGLLIFSTADCDGALGCLDEG